MTVTCDNLGNRYLDNRYWEIHQHIHRILKRNEFQIKLSRMAL